MRKEKPLSESRSDPVRRSKATPDGVVADINAQSPSGDAPARIYPDSPPVLGHGDLAEYPFGKIND